MSVPFLLEVGTEEIPDWMIEPALEHLRTVFQELLVASNVGGIVTRVDATPRRLVLWAEGLRERQLDAEEKVMGPPKSTAYKDGQPTGAAIGFAKKLGVDVAALTVDATPKGEYLSYLKRVAGRETSDVLADALPGLITNIYFPKTMVWTGRTGPRFIRPIRWVVALLADRIVPFSIAGVPSGDQTWGHRQLSAGPVQVTVTQYEQSLAESGVIVSTAERERRIGEGMAERLQGTGRVAKSDPTLLRTLAFLTEYPSVIEGHFPPEFLSLPEEVLVMVMRHHQRYFGVLDSNGRLAPHFLAVTNTKGDPDGLIQRGHERVLRARFKDARFFYDVDQQKKLEARLADLEHVTFQAKLGNYRAKTDRVVALAGELASQLGADRAVCERAALLCKCDLTTEMVKEFTDLQGIVGGLYARAQGEADEVANAIYDQYRPLSMEGTIPGTLAGQVLALADKIDTLRGCFAVGLIPSGSKDPFALRRAAQGVVKILLEGKLALPFSLVDGGDDQLRQFFLDRLQHYFREVRGFAYDEVNAVLAAGVDNLVDVDRRLDAIRAVRPTQDFEPLAASFKRIQNILRQAQHSGGGQADPTLLEPGPERDLHDEFLRVRSTVSGFRSRQDYRAALEAIASLRPKVDLFFDKVLVNAPDPRVRQNRLALLHTLLTESSTIADFSEIVTQ